MIIILIYYLVKSFIIQYILKENKIGSNIIIFSLSFSLSLLNLNFLERERKKQEPARTHTHTNQIESTRPKINPYVAYMQEQLIHLFFGPP